MQRYGDVLQNARGEPIAGLSVTVLTDPGGVAATLYSDNGVTLISGNVLTTDSLGEYEFFAADGRYQVVISGLNIVTKTINGIVLDDSAVSGNSAANSTAIVSGTANALSATISTVTLADGVQVNIRALLANTTTAPTFAFNGGAALPIRKQGNQAVIVGEWGVNWELVLRYHAAGARWELVNTQPVYPLAIALGGTGATTGGAALTALGGVGLASNNVYSGTQNYNNSVGFSGGVTFGVGVVPLISKQVAASTEGAELDFAIPDTGTSLTGPNVIQDINGNQIRFFDGGGTARGFFVDISQCAAGVGTNLLTSVSRTMVRQCAQIGTVDANGQPSFITAGVGLTYNVLATTTPLVVSYGAGFGSFGAVDLISRLTADMNANAIPADNVNHLYAVYATASTATLALNLIPEQDGEAFDRAAQSLLHFEQNGAAPLDDFGMTWSLVGAAAINNVKPAYGAYSLNLSGGVVGNTNSAHARTTDFRGFPDGSWEMSAVTWFDQIPSAGNNHYLISAVNATGFGVLVGVNNTAGTYRTTFYVAGQATSFDIANAVIGGTTNIVTGRWYKFRVIFDALNGRYRVFLADGASGASPVWAAEVLESNTASTRRVCATKRLLIGAYTSNDGSSHSNGISGWVDEFRFLPCATNINLETPAAGGDGLPYPVSPAGGRTFVPWYDTKAGIMYRVSAASASAGANPTFVAVNWLFLGEIDTNAANVVAIRHRPYQGRYRSAPIAFPSVSTISSVSHNMGTNRIRVRALQRARGGNVSTIDASGEEECQTAYNPGSYVYSKSLVSNIRRNVATLNNDNVGVTMTSSLSAGGWQQQSVVANFAAQMDLIIEAQRSY